MAFIKFSGDDLFDGKKLRGGDQVLILTVEGEVESIVPLADAGENVIRVPGIVTPGFINCHCHLELSHMKGLIAEGTDLVEFVTRVVLDRHHQEDAILAAIEAAEAEMLDNGIVAVGDICNNAHTIPQKTKGRIWYHNFIETSGFADSVAAARFERAVELFREYGKNYSVPVESNSIVPHAPYSVSDGLWKLILGFPGNHLQTIHNQESEAEEELFHQGTGPFLTLFDTLRIDATGFRPPGHSSLRQFLPRFLPNQPLILVHNVFTSAADIAFCQQLTPKRRISWCLCPNANLYITGRLPDIPALMKSGFPIVLGTDSLASNHQLSILSEIQTIRSHFPFLTVSEVLSWATLNGARALQLEQLLGSFEKGKRPGVVLCDEGLTMARRLL